MSNTGSNLIHMGWIGLGWIFFKLTMVGWVEKTSWPDPCTPLASSGLMAKDASLETGVGNSVAKDDAL